MIKIPAKSTLVLAILSVTAPQVHAAGFALANQAGSGTGNAFAGGVAITEDATVSWYNPANMPDLHAGTHISAITHIISPSAKFNNRGSWINPALTGGDFTAAQAALVGVNDNGGHAVGLPAFNMARSLNDRMSFGLALNVPFGLGTKYEKDWTGRYHALESEIQTLNVNPSIGYKINDQFSIGAGLSAQYIHVKLDTAIDSAAACRSIAAAANNGDVLAQCLANLPKLGHAATDSKASISGDDISYGYNFGITYKPNSNTRIGLAHRSKIDHKLEGDADYTINAAFQPILTLTGITNFNDTSVTAEANLPATSSLSIAHKVNDKLEVMGDYTRTGWSSFERLTIKRASDGSIVTDVDHSWEDTNRYALGASYQYSDRLKLRGGIALDETPVPNDKLRTPRTPDNDRTWIALGANYKLNKQMSLDVAYAHLFADETPIDNISSDNGYTLRGLYNNSVNIAGAQLNWSF
ncbi:MAG: hydrocarbon degradation protein [Proteobacteria bacterium]|nr:MAG: hydrocarbon degradation protein [Pseudomonadota bacterium]